MSGYTKGPWFAHGRYIGTKNHKSSIGECRDVNGNWSDEEPSAANARLIAAAPELLEALEDCVALLECIKEHWVDYDHVFSTGVHDAKAAIKKAKGE